MWLLDSLRWSEDGQFKTILVSHLTAEQFVKDIPELNVKRCIDDWVDGAVDIAKPRYHGDEGGADVTWLTQDLGDVDDEERCPTGQKHTWNTEDNFHFSQKTWTETKETVSWNRLQN